MCSLYELRAPRDEVRRHFGAADGWGRDLEKDYVASGREGFVVAARDGGRSLTAMRWGFPPPPGVRGPVVNVRNYGSPFWRAALADPARRCLVPVTRFSEWSAEPDPATGRKRQHWFSVPSRPVFAFAGVWRPTGDGPMFAFLTTGYDGDPAAHLVGRVHPKAVPVILHDEDHARWLEAPAADALRLAVAFPSQLLAVDA